MDEESTGANGQATGDTPRKRGRPAAAHPSNLIKVTLTLDEGDAEWGKGQPGGLSVLVRRLLKEEKARS